MWNGEPIRTEGTAMNWAEFQSFILSNFMDIDEKYTHHSSIAKPSVRCVRRTFVMSILSVLLFSPSHIFASVTR